MFIGRRSNAKLAAKRAQIAGKSGNPVTLQWIEWTGTAPSVDPTTGAAVQTESSGVATAKQCVTRACVHYAGQTTGRLKMFSEVRVGDCILEMTAPLIRVTTAGDTTLTAGAVVDQWAFNAANRLITDAEEDIAVGAEVQIESLSQLTFLIEGITYTQAKISKELLASWEAIVAGVKVCRSILLTSS